MKCSLIVLIAVLLVVLATISCELQGPLVDNTVTEKTNAKESAENTDSAGATTAQQDAAGEPNNDITDNKRKAAKYIDDQMETAQTAAQIAASIQGTEEDAKTKLLKFAIFERLWNDELARKTLIEEIESLEAKKPPVEHVEPTPEQIEAQSMYEKAMEMLSKPNSDKRVAFTLLRKSVDLNHSKARAEMAWAHVLGHYMDFNFEYAAAEFDQLAAQGLPEANLGLAFLYSVGVGGKNVSQPLALIHLTLAALGDNTFAQMALGYRYSFGINVPGNCEKSLSYYKKVAKKVAKKVTFSSGPMVHRVRLLDELENPGSQETEIVDYYQLLADKGDVQSQVGLGQLYYQGGKAIQQDHQKALEYFTLAANAGNAVGYAFLGKLYLEGSDNIKADNETAFKYFAKAASLGDPVGQSGLGLMHLKGLGVPKDPLKALNYFTMAADQGWVDGQLMLGNMYFTGNGVTPDFKLASKYFNLASQSGHVLAYYNLGFMHAYGIGMLRSCPAAVEFFKTVAERGRWSTTLMHAYGDYKNYRPNEAYMQYALLSELGYEVAQSSAAFLLDRGDVTIFHDRHEELIRAFYYWKRSAAQGYSAAQVKLGDYYYYGWGTNVDYETAAALYRKASEQQYNAQAMFNLGYMHEKGLGMKKDWHLAKRLYDLAAVTNADAKVPVALALFKLQMLAKIESIKDSPYKFIFYLDENIAANWDLYMITILTLLLGFLTYIRRMYDNNGQRGQTAQQAAAPPAQGAGDQDENAGIQQHNDNANSNDNIAGATTSESSTGLASSADKQAESKTSPSAFKDATPSSSTSTTTTKTTTAAAAATSALSGSMPSAASNSTADPIE